MGSDVTASMTTGGTTSASHGMALSKLDTFALQRNFHVEDGMDYQNSLNAVAICKN